MVPKAWLGEMGPTRNAGFDDDEICTLASRSQEGVRRDNGAVSSACNTMRGSWYKNVNE